MYILYLLAGFILLYFGAELLVKGSSAIALQFGVKKIVIGLTIVSIGTSLPEFVVSLFAALDRVDDVSVGNIVGSNLANILLVLGLATLIRPIHIKKRIVLIEMPVLIAISVLFVFFCRDQRLIPLESGILLCLFLIYLVFIISNSKIRTELVETEDLPVQRHSLAVNLIMTVVGIFGLIIGGQLTIRGAVDLARVFQVPEVVIGLTIVAVGTSLPELFTSVIAAIRGEDEISIGNVIGSNLFNVAFILGFVPLIYPLRISPSIVRVDNWLMLAATLLLGIFTLFTNRISRWMGFSLVSGYIIFLLNLIFHFI